MLWVWQVGIAWISWPGALRRGFWDTSLQRKCLLMCSNLDLVIISEMDGFQNGHIYPCYGIIWNFDHGNVHINSQECLHFLKFYIFPLMVGIGFYDSCGICIGFSHQNFKQFLRHRAIALQPSSDRLDWQSSKN